MASSALAALSYALVGDAPAVSRVAVLLAVIAARHAARLAVVTCRRGRC
jgi:hypothetical protein